MKKIKKLLICLLAGCLTMGTLGGFTASAAEGEAEPTYEEKKAAYREKIMADDVTADDFLIGVWEPHYSTDIHSYDEQLDQMAAAGVNFNLNPHNNWWYLHDPAFWDEIEAQFSQRNMVYLMFGSHYGDLTDTGVSYAAGREHCVGYYIIDEPGGDLLADVGAGLRLYETADPDRFCYVNLLPSYAGEERLGGTYREHVENFVAAAGAENLEYLSHDYYPFRANGLDAGIYADAEVLRAVAYENGKLKTHACTQSTAWNGMRMPTADELRWNVYLYLAYGFKAFSWFTLVCPGTSDTEGEGFYDSLIYRDGTIRDPELFAAWSELNWEVRGLSPILMNLDAAHAYHVKDNEIGVETLPEDFFLQPANRNDFIISVMESKEGEDEYIMIFNKNSRREVNGAFTVDPASGVKWVEYFDPRIGEYIPMEPEDGILHDTYRKGEGKLYRLRYDDPPSETEAVTTEAPTDAVTDAPAEDTTKEPETNAPVTNAPETNAPATNAPETNAPAKEGGCSSAVGFGAVAVTVTAAAAALAVRKKKEE